MSVIRPRSKPRDIVPLPSFMGPSAAERSRWLKYLFDINVPKSEREYVVHWRDGWLGSAIITPPSTAASAS